RYVAAATLEASAPLDAHRDGVSPAEAEGGQAPLRAAVLHAVDQGREHASPAASDRVTEGDRPAVHVELVMRHPELSHHCDARRGIGLIVLEEIDVVDR